MTVETPTDYCAHAIRMAALRTVRRYRGYVEVDDMISEANLWVHQHPKKVAEYFTEAADGRTETVARRRFATQVERVMEKHARSAKAAIVGFHPDDQFQYGKAVLEQVMPALYSEEYSLSAPIGEQEEIRGNADPAESGNWGAYVLDVKAAYARASITDAEHTALLLKFGMGLTEERAAAVMAVGRFVYRDLVSRSMRRVMYRLNGVEPEPECKPDCEDRVLVGAE